MGTLKGLAARLNAEADKLDERGSRAAADTALVVISALAYDTPVDTTNALSNWQIGLGAPVPTGRGPFYPGERGSTYAASAAETVRAAKAALAAKRPGETVYISNLAPYIRKLNYEGHSAQGSHFVETAVIRGKEYLRRRNKTRG